MIQLTQVIGAWLLASILLPTAAAHTATYYVATTGNNSNPGTSSKPWRTVAYAVSTMVAGDTTYVLDGTYNEGTIRFRRSGTRSAPIKLLNYPGHAPRINFIDPTAIHRILIQHSSGPNVAIGWITIEGLELVNGHDGIKFHSLHDSTIRRNWIHDNRFMGIMGVGGTRNVFEQNRINHNGWFEACDAGGTKAAYCILHHGMYMHGSYYTIANNIIYDNLSYGITQNGSSSSSYSSSVHPGPEFATASNWVIAHNTFAYNRHRGGIVVWGGACDDTRIENNIFYENNVTNRHNAAQGIEFVGAGGANGMSIRNNHFYASGSGNTLQYSGPQPRDLVSTGNVVNVSPPRFVDAPDTLPDSPNFALTAGSPAIDAGLPLETTRTSFDGTPRPQGRAPDIGAYEFSGGADAKSPAAPVGLQAH